MELKAALLVKYKILKSRILKNYIPIFTKIIAVYTLFFVSFCNNASAISISKERELAVEFMDSIEKQDKLIKDPAALSLISEIGNQIVKKLPPQPFKYSFYIMDEEQFNAFAGPGSNIFINRGLITSLDNVHELAGIIGHEIAHSSCRHISDLVDQSKIMTIGTLAGVLAGVLVGASGGASGGDLGQALLIGSVSAGQTAMLAYSREHETEADQKGLVYLTNAGFNPEGLLTGLEKIRSRDWFGSESIPDYLKTHPGSAERIVMIQSWIEEQNKNKIEIVNKDNNNLKNRSTLSNKEGLSNKESLSLQNIIDPFRFEMVKYRLAGLYSNEDDAEKLFNSILQKEPDNSAANYGMALLMERKNRIDESLKLLRKALETKMFEPHILIELGKITTLLGNPKKAVEIMQGLETIPEVEIEALFYISQAKLMAGVKNSADNSDNPEHNFKAEAEKGFEKVIQTPPYLFPKAYYYLAEIKGKNGDIGLSHYYLGLYYYEINNLKSSRFHLQKSLETLSDKDKRKHAEVMIARVEIKHKGSKRKK